MTLDKEKAETIALQALSFLAQDEELLEQFMTQSGLTPDQLKERFKDPELLGGILDALLSSDEALLKFCSLCSLSPETIVLARRALPGGFILD